MDSLPCSTRLIFAQRACLFALATFGSLQVFAQSSVACMTDSEILCRIESKEGIARVVVEQAAADGVVVIVDAHAPACQRALAVGWHPAVKTYDLSVVTCRPAISGLVPRPEDQIDLFAVREADVPNQTRAERVASDAPGSLRRRVRISSDMFPIAVVPGDDGGAAGIVTHCGNSIAFCGDGLAGSDCGVENPDTQQSCPGTVETPPDENGNPSGPYCSAEC